MTMPPSSEITYNRVVKLSLPETGESATGFYLKIVDRIYLITAKHFVNGLDNAFNYAKGDAYSKQGLSIEVDESNLPIEVVKWDCKKNADISILTSPDFESKCHKLDNIDNFNIQFGQDAYILGFPHGKYYTKDSSQINDGLPYPFFKKTVISAQVKQIDGSICYFLDGYNHQGFSGGPLVAYDYTNKQWKIIAIVSSYVCEESDQGINLKSGIFRAYSIKSVVDMLRDILEHEKTEI